MLPTRDPPQGKGLTQIESKGMEKRYLTQIEMTRKQELQQTLKTIKKEGHCIMIKRS